MGATAKLTFRRPAHPRSRIPMVAVVCAGVALVLLGCGDGRDAGSSTARPTATATTGEPVGDDRIPPPATVSLENTNDRSTPIGNLCWHRRELVMTMVEHDVSGSDDDEIVTDYRTVFQSARDTVPGTVDALPAGVGEFAHRFLADITTASDLLDELPPRDAQERIRLLFPFDDYAGSSAYIAAAEAGCEQP